MAVAEKTKKKKAGALKHRGQMPTKRTINLAAQREKKVRIGLAIPAILLILAAAVAFSKFLVIDRMAEVSAARNEVYQLQRRLDAGYEELAGFDDLAELYAHYTYSGFTAEELGRADRVLVLDLMQRVVLPQATVNNWSLTGNELTINMTCGTLQEVNLIVQQLEKEDLVDFCMVYTANTNDNTRNNLRVGEFGEVRAKVVVYLSQRTGVDNG